jgi:hypothetical protein
MQIKTHLELPDLNLLIRTLAHLNVFQCPLNKPTLESRSLKHLLYSLPLVSSDFHAHTFFPKGNVYVKNAWVY